MRVRAEQRIEVIYTRVSERQKFIMKQTIEETPLGNIGMKTMKKSASAHCKIVIITK